MTLRPWRFVKQAIKRTILYDLVRWLRPKGASRWTRHDDDMLSFYGQFVSAGGLCFDVGANIGNRVKVFLAIGARVIAVEPQPDCISSLERDYGSSPLLTVVPQALGAAEGEAEIMIGSVNTISSLSPEWIAAVTQSDRFAGHNWNRKQMVSMTTLDRLIDRYGVPDLVKIDVEGFEYQVIRGLSRPLKVVSLEFVPEFIESTLKCIAHLQHLGEIRLNYSMGESVQLAADEWLLPGAMLEVLERFRGDREAFGDVYVRFEDGSRASSVGPR